jgi:uncharacterized protein YggL (DUF469 family)
VNDDFQILLEFLESDQPEVAGRAAATVSPEFREKLVKFAAGSCTEEERAQVKKMLQEQPYLLPALARETLALRQPQE